MDLKAALQYIVESAKCKIVEVDGKTYSTQSLQEVKERKYTPDPIVVGSLTGFVDCVHYMTRNEFNDQFTHVMNNSLIIDPFIHVVDYNEVAFMSGFMNDEYDRYTYARAKYHVPSVLHEKTFYDIEEFNIKLMTNFVKLDDDDDKSTILKVLSNIRDEKVSQASDDGISQTVTAKTGVAMVENVKIENPVFLAPYRTFLELDQPVTSYILRLQNGPKAALFCADGDGWKHDAKESIRAYLKEQIKLDIPIVC